MLNDGHVGLTATARVLPSELRAIHHVFAPPIVLVASGLPDAGSMIATPGFPATYSRRPSRLSSACAHEFDTAPTPRTPPEFRIRSWFDGEVPADDAFEVGEVHRPAVGAP